MDNVGYLAFLVAVGFYSGKLLLDILYTLIRSLIEMVHHRQMRYTILKAYKKEEEDDSRKE